MIGLRIAFAFLIGTALFVGCAGTRNMGPEIPAKIEVAGQQIPLIFERPELSPETRNAIAADIELNLSHLDKVVFHPRPDAHVQAPPSGYDRVITHDLANIGGWPMPNALRGFGGAVRIDGRFHLLLSRRQIEAYEKALDFKERHREIFDKVGPFIATLRDPEKMRSIASDPERARDMFYFHEMPPWEKLETYAKNLHPNDSPLKIRAPSVLDFSRLRENPGFEDAPEDVLVFATVITYEKDGKKGAVKFPPFAYVDGKWRIMVLRLGT